MQPISPVMPTHFSASNPQGTFLQGGAREVVFAKDQPEYIPLPAVVLDDGTVISRWRLTFAERLRLLVGGSIWLECLTFKRPLQPVRLSVREPKPEYQEPRR